MRATTKRPRISSKQRKAIRRAQQVFEKAAREGKLRPTAWEGGKVIGWAGDAEPDDCPLCAWVAKEEETPYAGTKPRLCSRCGETIWLLPEEIRRKKKRLCYRCFMRMKPRPPAPPGRLH